MLKSAAIERPLQVSEMYRDPCRVDDAGPKVVQFLDRDQSANPTSPLNRYIEGWAQNDLEKILDATAPSYRFTDPFVGIFRSPVATQIFRSLAGQTLPYRSNRLGRSRYLPARPNEAAVPEGVSILARGATDRAHRSGRDRNRRTRRGSRTRCIRPQPGVRHIVPRLGLALIIFA